MPVPPHTRPRAPDQGEGGVPVRICIVASGPSVAVRGEPGELDGVGCGRMTWRRMSTRSTATACGSPRRRRPLPSARDVRRGRAAALRLRDVATSACIRVRDRATGARVCERLCGDRQNGIGNEDDRPARRAGDSRHDLPRGQGDLAGHCAVGRERRHDLGPFEPQLAPLDAIGSWPRVAAPACRPPPSRTRARSGAR